jgi:uncharacterized membrane protein
LETGNDVYIGSPDHPRTAAIVSYITFIGWLISFFGLHRFNKTSYSSFHLRQSLLIHIFSFILKFVYSFSLASIGSLIFVAFFSILLFILWLRGFLDAINGKEKPIPVIGAIAQKIFHNL